MNVVDSSAWLSYFAGDTNADSFSEAIEDIEQLIVPTVILTEVFKWVLRQRGEDIALKCIAHMQQGILAPLDASLALDAAQYGIEHKLPLADSIIYATARKWNAIVWTQDSDFKSLDHVNYFSK